MRKLSSASQTSRRAINTSIGRPTLRFERMVESTETRPTLGIVEVDVVGDGAIEHRLAVFMLADLQIGRILCAFDEIAGGVEHEQPRALAPDLPAKQERDVEFHVRSLERLALDLVQLTDDAADALRRLKHGRCVYQRLGF